MALDWRHWFEKKEHHGYDAHPTKLGKVWHFIAHDESWLSFVADAAIVLLLGQFVVIPLFGFAFGTNFPFVAVVSSSMDHGGLQFDEWWTENGQWYLNHNITKPQFEGFYKPDGFVKGDAFVVHGVNSKAKIGDVLVYTAPGWTDPIIHRVVTINKDGTYQTKGDANTEQFSFEKSVTDAQIQGKAVAWAPYLGWPKTLLKQMMGGL
ncbi:MAG: hypothetical protein V1839_03455 [archaeon]